MAQVQNDFDKSTDLYDKFYPIIKERIKNPTTWRRFLKLTQDFFSKNDTKLSTNIVGKQVLLSSKVEDEIYDIFGVEKKEISEVMNNSACFKARFNGKKLSLDDQLCLALPLILAAIEYQRLKKKDESELCYLMAHFKPYASRESFLFKYGVDEARMLYTVENLSNRFDLKVYGTIIDTLQKKAAASYSNYIDSMKKDEKMTDYRFYVCYSSGIASSMNSFIGLIYKEYMNNEGKKLSFEQSAMAYKDDDTGEDEYTDSNIQSDAAIRDNIVKRTMQALAKNPIEKGLLVSACKIKDSFSPTSQTSLNNYIIIMSNVINEIVDKMSDKLPDFFSGLINSFLFHFKSDGSRTFTMNDFKSPVFLAVGIDILAGKKSNVKDINMLRCRNILTEMCSNFSTEYNTHGETYKRQMKRCLAAYWVFLMKFANSGR